MGSEMCIRDRQNVPTARRKRPFEDAPFCSQHNYIHTTCIRCYTSRRHLNTELRPRCNTKAHQRRQVGKASVAITAAVSMRLLSDAVLMRGGNFASRSSRSIAKRRSLTGCWPQVVACPTQVVMQRLIDASRSKLTPQGRGYLLTQATRTTASSCNLPLQSYKSLS